MVHYGPLAGAAAQSLQLTAMDTGDQQPLNYMRSNGAALLVASSDVVDQQHHLQQQQQQLQQAQGKTAGRNQFFCDQCNMVFGSKSAHTSHMKSHMKFAAQAVAAAAVAVTGELNPVDGQEGSSVGPFNGAAMTGSGNGGDPYQCDKCNKTFAVPARLVSEGMGKALCLVFGGGKEGKLCALGELNCLGENKLGSFGVFPFACE